MFPPLLRFPAKWQENDMEGEEEEKELEGEEHEEDGESWGGGGEG